MHRSVGLSAQRRTTRARSLASNDDVTLAAFHRVRPLLGAKSLLLASDFDGTLSHFVSDPWSASILSTAGGALRRLAGDPRVHVALISGRTVADLAGRARVGGISYRGDHGAQSAEAVRGFRPAALHITQEPVDGAVFEMVERLGIVVATSIAAPWLIVEDKDAAMTFHFRTAPDLDSARARIMAIIDAIDVDLLLVRTVGRRAVELRPRTASNKGDALLRLVREHHADAAVMLGDDRNDAMAFEALRAARAAGEIDGLAIAVAGHPDFTTHVAHHADLVLAGPAQAARLLNMLARAAIPVR